MTYFKFLITALIFLALNAYAEEGVVFNKAVEKVGLVKVTICGEGNICKLGNIFLTIDENRISDLKIEGKLGESEVKITSSKLTVKDGKLFYDGKEVSATSTSGNFKISAKEGKSGVIIKFSEKKGLLGFGQLNSVNNNKMVSSHVENSAVFNNNRNSIDSKVQETGSSRNSTQQKRFGHTI
jgi:hypothetical protein